MKSEDWNGKKKCLFSLAWKKYYEQFLISAKNYKNQIVFVWMTRRRAFSTCIYDLSVRACGLG